MDDVTFASLHGKMNFLLEDHGVKDFNESALDLEAVSSLHAKANALCTAHGGDPSSLANDTLDQLHPKLDFLMKGHGVSADTEHLDPDALEAVDAKITAIVNAHED